MSDLIRRSDVLCGKFVSTDSIYERGWNDALDAVAENAPAMDAVEVVRCRECAYYNTSGCSYGFGWCESPIVNKGTTDDFYCAAGQRREDGDA